jgi:AraC-like DNA-binding protein
MQLSVRQALTCAAVHFHETCECSTAYLHSTMLMWQTIRGSCLERHMHNAAYATVIIAGAYEEAGDQGRFKVSRGEAILHERFESHRNLFGPSGTRLLNLPVHDAIRFSAGAVKVVDLDLVIGAAERSREEAIDVLLENVRQRQRGPYDWPDELAAALREDPSVKLGQWAEEHRIAPWTVSRGFRQVYGVSPERFRMRMRSRRAWKMIETSRAPLVDS